MQPGTSSNPQALQPFACQYTPNVPELLQKLHMSLVISTYQAGKLVIISPKDNESLVQLPRTFAKAMGVTLQGEKMAVATKDEVIVLANSPQLANYYPKNPGVYDALFMPRCTYYTGQIDIHDIDWGRNNELFAVNTSFSCIIKIDDNYSYIPIWKPPFISNLASEDRCHLNGMAMVNGQPKYVTAFSTGDSPQSWRETVTTSGIIMDAEQNEIVIENLAMPHSPRWYNGQLYCLLSATGELIAADPTTGKTSTIYQAEGFVRGLAIYKDYAFIGFSKLRKNSSTFAKLDIAEKATWAGISIVHLPTGAYVGQIKYLNSVDEIYDVQAIPNSLRPGILNTLKPEHKLGIATPNATYWASLNDNADGKN